MPPVGIILFLTTLSLIPLVPAGFGDVNDAHSIATNYMISSKEGAVGTSDTAIPIVFSAVDGEKLVVGISTHVLLQNTTYTEEQIQDLLGVDVPIEIKYMSFAAQAIETGPARYPVDFEIPPEIYETEKDSGDVYLDMLESIFNAWEDVLSTLGIRSPS